MSGTQLVLGKAKRSQAWLKLGISGASGSGKTLSSLLLGYGLLKKKYPHKSDAELWGMIAIIDTENRSGELYVGTVVKGQKIGEYNAIPVSAPFDPGRFISAMKLCEDNGIEVAIIDTASKVWTGEGGLLEAQANAAKRSGNSYTAWRDVTPEHNKFVEYMLQSKLHVIVCMRAKQEYVQEKDQQSGKTSVRKVGMEPEMRRGIEFEFTTFLEINAEHQAFGAKDRMNLLDGKTFVVTPETGAQMMEWLLGADTTATEVVAKAHQAEPEVSMDSLKKEVLDLIVGLGGSKNNALMDVVKNFTGGNANFNVIKEATVMAELKNALEQFQAEQAVAA